MFNDDANYPLATASGSVPAVPYLRRRLLVRKDVARVFRTGWIDRHVALVYVLNDPVFVDHKRRAIAIAALFIEDAIVLHHTSLLKITQKREGKAQLFGKFAVSIRAVNADAENLGVRRIEFGDISLIRLHFLRSTTGKCKNVKGEDDVLLAFEVAELVTNASAVRAYDSTRQSEVRRCLANFQIGVRRSGRRCPGRCRCWSWLLRNSD